MYYEGSNKLLCEIFALQTIDQGGRFWCGAGIAGYRWNYWTAIARSDRLFLQYTQSENIKHFQ